MGRYSVSAADVDPICHWLRFGAKDASLCSAVLLLLELIEATVPWAGPWK